MSAADVLKAIEEAWRDAPYPGDERLIPRPKQPNGSCRDEYDYVADFFAGKRWNDLTKSAVLEGYEGPAYACLSFMSPDAFRFYLPAFMLITIKEYDPGDMMCQAALYALVPPRFDPKLYEKAKLPGMTDETNPCSRANVEKLRLWWDERVAGFSAAQRRAIAAFLEYMVRIHGADYKYDSAGPQVALQYWGK